MNLILTIFSSFTGEKLKRLRLSSKLIVLISLFAVASATASVYSESQKISINVESIQLRDLFREIENNSEYAFFFNDQFEELDKMVSMDIADEEIDNILAELLEDTQLDYEILDNNFVVIVPKASEQPAPIKGRVTDIDDNGIPGVNIIEQGTTNGVITDLDGNYSINVSEGATLVFSSIGYNEEVILVGNQTTIDLVMIESLEELGEVVVIGYGALPKEAVTGSVASIGGDEMRDVPSANITQALQGRMPGVEMMQTSSQPGAEMQIRIRGTRSISGDNSPLIVLDGIPFAGSISDINPSDIKSVDILKDASATAIYGSRGANGVIILTTQKGRKGQKPTVTYNGYHGMKNAIKYPMMNGDELAELRAVAGRYPRNGEDEVEGMNTDWQDLFYRTAQVSSHDLGIIGGTEHGSYNFGMGYYLDQAVIPSQQYQRISMRAAVDQEIGKYLKLGVTSNNNFNLTEGTQIGMYGMLSLSPLIDPYNADGTFKRTVLQPLDESWIYPRDVIDEVKDRWLREKRGYGTYNNFYGELKIPGIEGLKYRLNLGLNMITANTGNFTGEGINSTNPTSVSTASVENTFKTSWVVENLLTFDRTFNDKHTVNIVGLYSAEENKYNKSYMSARDIPEEGFQFYNLGHAAGTITVDPGQQDYKQSGLISWMGRAMYTYDNRYMITGTMRSDGSSRLAPGYKWHTYPAVSVGWNLGREAFMANITAINSLKLRFGYGQTSNQAVDEYATLGLLETVPYNFGNDVYQTGTYVSSLPNPGLGWEYSKTLNYGLDFSLLEYRLTGTIEYYQTQTEDILYGLGLPPTSGVTEGYTANIGKTENKGFEFSVNGVILDNPDGFRWEVGVNLYANRNKLTELASGQEEDIANFWFVGYPINSIYDYKNIGLWQEGDTLLQYLEPGGSNVPGMIKVEYTGEYDENGIPERPISSADRQVISLEPDFLGGFNTRLSYKGFDLNVVGTFQRGGVLISTLYSSAGYLNLHSGRRGNVKIDYWTPENTGAKYPIPSGPVSGDNPKYASTLGYFDGSYLKVRTISLGYNLPGNLTSSIGIDKLRVYVTAQNPFVMFSPYHKESGMDPETNSYGNENAAVAYNQRLRRILTVGANTPSTRNFLVGLNVTF